MVICPLNNILFLDIETVSQYDSFEELPAEWQSLWTRKAELISRDKLTDTPASLYNRAAIYAEFGKIICISCGVFSGTGTDRRFLIKSFAGDDERQILQAFCSMVDKWSLGAPKYLCAHNGKEFDFPYLCRRLIINHIPLPALLNLTGKRPWEIPHLDTLELWKFGDYKSYISLNLLAHTLDIPTPKDDIDGSMVGEVYWKNQDLDRIVTYCQKDVVTLAHVYLRLNSESPLGPECIDIK